MLTDGNFFYNRTGMNSSNGFRIWGKHETIEDFVTKLHERQEGWNMEKTEFGFVN